MKTKKRLLTPTEKTERIQSAMRMLVGNDAFQDFIEELREQQHNAMLDGINEAVLKDERLALAVAGEIRAYEGIISLYDSLVQQRLTEADIEAEDAVS